MLLRILAPLFISVSLILTSFTADAFEKFDPERAMAALHEIAVREGFSCKSRPLAFGNYGMIVVCKLNDKRFVIKAVQLFDDENSLEPTTLKEIATLRSAVGSEHLLSSDKVYFKSRLAFIALKFFPINLLEIIPPQLGLSSDYLQSYIAQISLGIRELHHGLGVMHLDLKPQNILISKSGRVVIGDFGLVQQLPLSIPASRDPYTSPNLPASNDVVTLWYRSPNLLLGPANYDKRADFWSLGTTFIEMVTGSPAFPGDSEADQLLKIFGYTGFPHADGLLKNFINPYTFSNTNIPEGPQPLHANPLVDIRFTPPLKNLVEQLLKPFGNVSRSEQALDAFSGRVEELSFVSRKKNEAHLVSPPGIRWPLSESLQPADVQEILSKLYRLCSELRTKRIIFFSAARLIHSYLEIEPNLKREELGDLAYAAFAISLAYSDLSPTPESFSDVLKREKGAPYLKFIRALIGTVPPIFPSYSDPYSLLMTQWSKGELTRAEYEMSVYMLELLTVLPPRHVSSSFLASTIATLSRLVLLDSHEVSTAIGKDLKEGILSDLNAVLGPIDKPSLLSLANQEKKPVLDTKLRDYIDHGLVSRPRRASTGGLSDSPRKTRLPKNLTAEVDPHRN